MCAKPPSAKPLPSWQPPRLSRTPLPCNPPTSMQLPDITGHITSVFPIEIFPDRSEPQKPGISRVLRQMHQIFHSRPTPSHLKNEVGWRCEINSNIVTNKNVL